MKQTTNTKVFMNKNVSVNLFFERIYSNIYIPKEQSAKDKKIKTLEQLKVLEKVLKALSN